MSYGELLRVLQQAPWASSVSARQTCNFEAFRISLAKFVKLLDDVVNVPQGADEEVNPNTYGSLERLVSIAPPGSLSFVFTYNLFNLFFADLCRSNLNKM